MTPFRHPSPETMGAGDSRKGVITAFLLGAPTVEATSPEGIPGNNSLTIGLRGRRVATLAVHGPAGATRQSPAQSPPLHHRPD
jgi:hypothetical protein